LAAEAGLIDPPDEPMTTPVSSSTETASPQESSTTPNAAEVTVENEQPTEPENVSKTTTDENLDNRPESSVNSKPEETVADPSTEKAVSNENNITQTEETKLPLANNKESKAVVVSTSDSCIKTEDEKIELPVNSTDEEQKPTIENCLESLGVTKEEPMDVVKKEIPLMDSSDALTTLASAAINSANNMVIKTEDSTTVAHTNGIKLDDVSCSFILP
jgi:hypothetical protein